MRDTTKTGLDAARARFHDMDPSALTDLYRGGDRTRQKADLVAETNAIVGMEYAADELTGWRSNYGDFEKLSRLVLAEEWEEATRLALLDEAKSVYSSLDSVIDNIVRAEADRRVEEAKEQEKDKYVETHTAHEWLGPRTDCMVKTRDGWSRCGRRGDFVSLEVQTLRYNDPVKLYFARVECTIHATRYPKADYATEWPLQPGRVQLAEFVTENGRWLTDLAEDAGVTLTDVDAFTEAQARTSR